MKKEKLTKENFEKLVKQLKVGDSIILESVDEEPIEPSEDISTNPPKPRPPKP